MKSGPTELANPEGPAMVLTTESCTRCERLTVRLRSALPLKSLQDLPTSYDRRKGRTAWRGDDAFGYAVVPRSAKGNQGEVDVYFCMDEDDFDDIDPSEFAARFVRERLSARWKKFKVVSISGLSEAAPEGVGCRKLRHVEPAGIPAGCVRES
jgi:hypothetical protein